MQSSAYEEVLMKTLECKSHRLHKQSISHNLLPKKNSQRDRTNLEESNILSCSETTTHRLLRKISSLQPNSQLSIKKDQLFTLLKGKNISVSRSQSKQKKINMQKNSSNIFHRETSRIQLNKLKKVAFNTQKWRFNRQRSIIKFNQEDDKLRKMKEKMFLNTKILSKTLLNLQKGYSLRL